METQLKCRPKNTVRCMSHVMISSDTHFWLATYCVSISDFWPPSTGISFVFFRSKSRVLSFPCQKGSSGSAQIKADFQRCPRAAGWAATFSNTDDRSYAIRPQLWGNGRYQWELATELSLPASHFTFFSLPKSQSCQVLACWRALSTVGCQRRAVSLKEPCRKEAAHRSPATAYLPTEFAYLLSST